MRAILIGTGFAAEIHAQILKDLGHTVVSIVNPHLEKAKAFARKWKITHATDDLRQALGMDPDTIHVCTPPVSHYEIIKTALASDLHVFCEKPLHTAPEQAFELVALAAEKKRIHAVNYNNRFYEACYHAKGVISQPEFGYPCMIHGAYLQEFHALPDYYSWRYHPDQAGAMRAVTEIGSHWIDLVRYWTGLEFQAVSATFAKINPDRSVRDGMMHPAQDNNGTVIHVDSEDAAVISMRFNNGAVGSLLLSEVSHGRTNQLKLEVSSPMQSIWWDSENPYHLHQAQKSSGINTHSYPFGKGFSGTFHDCIAAFYRDVESGSPADSPAYATFLDGARNTAVCTAIYDSAMNNSAWMDVHYDPVI